MLKTKYERMNKEEKQKTIKLYKKTSAGKTMLNRLLRLNIIGSILIVYAIVVFVMDINNLKLTNYLISIPVCLVGIFFIIMAYKLRKKTLNNFAIKQK